MPSVADITDYLNRFAPLSLAADWDNVGLLVGDPAAPAQKIMTCLTVTPSTVAEAVAAGAGLLVSHHPIFFRPSKRLTAATTEGRMILDLVRAGAAVYSPHTAFDNCAGGINDILARHIGLTDVTPLRCQEGARQCKFVVFVPEQDLAKVAEALFNAGAGHIGQYSQCSFRLPGTGTFFGSDATNPSVGEKGRREEVREWRLEAICPESLLQEVSAAVCAAHSYEEPAFDVYPLAGRPSASGMGRFGTLSEPVTLRVLAQKVKTLLRSGFANVVGDPERLMTRVAIVCGAGGDFINNALAKEADLLVTGEARFHDCLAAQALGLSLLLPGHYASERCGIEELADRLARDFADATVWASRAEADPLRQL